ncbi:MAG: 50S ribosomal protein L25 [Planctomycetota bacterium]|jgi:large subunit ribosomal protein L25|nr:50S ribosomal protein L25 [Planctomycetota bacterium]MDP7130674.1 50S ribosomal protein L25 [Planctomycetota bacterium]MDP7249524.1 50S ribosomal protein L25 [Planctomycetota bacterium]
MANATLSAETREGTGRRACNRLREEGRIPGVLYGRQQDVVHLSVLGDEFTDLLKGDNQIIDIAIDGATETVVVKELQFDFLGDDVLHVDFGRISMDEKIEIAVPVALKGEAIGVVEGGVLQQPRYEILVSCLPRETPSGFLLDISALNVGDGLLVRDVEVPEGIEVVDDADLLVVNVVASRGMKGEDEEDEEGTLDTGPLEPEVIGRGKTDEEEEEQE